MIRRVPLRWLHASPLRVQTVCVLVGGAILWAISFAALTSVRDSAATTARLARAEELAADIDTAAAQSAHMAAELEKSYYTSAAAGPNAPAFRIPALTAVDASERFHQVQSDTEELHGLLDTPATLVLLGTADDIETAYRGVIQASDSAATPRQVLDAFDTVMLPRIAALEQQSEAVHADIESDSGANAARTIGHIDLVRIVLVVESVLGILAVGFISWAVGRKLTNALRAVTAEKTALLATTRDIERRNGQFQALYQVVTEVGETLSLKYVVQTALREARQLMGADVVILRLLHGDTLEVAGALPLDGPGVSELHPRRLGEGIVGRAAKRGRAYRAGPDPEHPIIEGEGFPGARSGVVVPLIVGARVVGTLGCWSQQPGMFSADDEQVLEMMASQVATAVVAADTFETTEQQALHDPLTALPNRRQLSIDLRDRYGPALANGSPVAVGMADIDDFKHFNDDFGHKVGDVTLQRVAEVMRSTLRETDGVYRYGGEEFVFLVESDDRGAIANLMERVRGAVARAPLTGDQLQPVGPITISIGIAFGPEDSSDPEELIRMADAAMYEAKSAGRNQVSTYAVKADPGYDIPVAA